MVYVMPPSMLQLARPLRLHHRSRKRRNGPTRSDYPSCAAGAEARNDMADYFGGAVVTLECPECGTRKQCTVDQVRARADLSCVVCEYLLDVDGDELERALAHLVTVFMSPATLSPAARVM